MVSLRLPVPPLVATWRALVLVAGIVAIVSWQHGFGEPGVELDTSQRMEASTGLNQDRRFFFFLYRLGLYPIASLDAPRADTREAARELLHDHPQSLMQDHGSTFRSGDRGRTFLYFVDAWKRHDALTPSVKPANALAFTWALVALFVAGWSVGWTWQVAGLIVLLGSNPFQLRSVYVEENIFSWVITGMVGALAINFPLFDRRWSSRLVRYPYVAAVTTGLFLSLVKNLRSEPTVMLAGVALVHATMTWRPWRHRITQVMAMVAAFFLLQTATRAFFEHEFKRAAAAITEAGGTPYTGPREYHHEFWHPLFCGLGDFDTKYGYRWDDQVAYEYALPTLKQRFPDLDLRPRILQPFAWDDLHMHPKTFFEIPGYHDIIREKVLHDIRSDPRWYLDILWKRVNRILDDTTKVGVALGSHKVYAQGPALGWACIPLLVLLAAKRRVTELKLLLFSLPLSLSAFLVYSGGGMTYYSTFHLFGVFIVLCLAFEGLKRRGRLLWR